MGLSIGNPQPIALQDATALEELGFMRCDLTDWTAGAQVPPTPEQAQANAKRTQLEVTLDGKPVVFVIDGEHSAPVEGRVTIWEAFPYMHGDEQRYVWTVQNR